MQGHVNCRTVRSHHPPHPHPPTTKAIRVAIGTARPRDLVIVLGRGHEDCQEVWDGQELGGTLQVWGARAWCRGGGGGGGGGEALRRPVRATPVSSADVPMPAFPDSQGWFDDRLECRAALAKLPRLNRLKDLDRTCLPWTRCGLGAASATGGE